MRMPAKTEYPPRLKVAVLLSTAFLGTLLFSVAPGVTILPVSMGDVPYLAYLTIHVVWAAALVAGGPRRQLILPAQRRAGELLFFAGAFLFLFSYIFASNANMDYVQRFVASGGELQLAPDTATERRIAAGRYLLLLLVDAGLWVGAVLGDARATVGARLPGPWAAVDRRAVAREAWRYGADPLLVILSVVLSVLAVPSFVSLAGWGGLGWISLAPLFLVLHRRVGSGQAGRAVGYGVLYGVLTTLVGNYWLGTFNLISLQAVGVIFLGFYLLFMPLVVLGLRLAPPGWPRVLVLPLAWTAFELARSSGFLGYPWLLVAHSQYANLPLIQWAELGGVWLVSLIVLMVNASITAAVLRRSWRWGVGALAILLVAHGGGALFLLRDLPTRDTVRVALVQQNSDPRKHDYERTLAALQRITDRTLEADPDLVVWSETAFVPNIRRWSQEDPQRYRLARLVREFLAYQRSLDRWLLTGNDDYRRILDDDGTELERNSYNAAVLFDPAGQRRDTYHKIRLVPFTEHFPFQRQFPWVYSMLQDFDIAFWTPGSERTIFEHPSMRFATPICFEDVFPQEVRRFAQAGMEVIVNITNDYWSLQETAAQQHFVAALFRTVELRRPMVRSTASGVTSHIDARGRIVATVPQYSEQYLIADVAVPAGDPATMYLRWGDWVPRGAMVGFLAILMAGIIRRRNKQDGRRQGGNDKL